MEDNDLFYADVLNNLLSILGKHWHIHSRKFGKGKYIALQYMSKTYASGVTYYNVIKCFNANINTKIGSYGYLMKEIRNIIPDFLKVDSIEELLIQIDFHRD